MNHFKTNPKFVFETHDTVNLKETVSVEYRPNPEQPSGGHHQNFIGRGFDAASALEDLIDQMMGTIEEQDMRSGF